MTCKSDTLPVPLSAEYLHWHFGRTGKIYFPHYTKHSVISMQNMCSLVIKLGICHQRKKEKNVAGILESYEMRLPLTARPNES